MHRRISTLWRFLLPVLVLLVSATFILTRQQSSQQLVRIEEGAAEEAKGLARLLHVSEALVGEQSTSSMLLLLEKADQLGMPSIDGTVSVQGKTLPNLMLGNFPQTDRIELVDSITDLLGGTATLFVKSGDDFVRVSTNVMHADGTRAIGTQLDPHGKAIAAIRQGKSFQGVVDILGEPYITRYEPMLDAAGSIIGAWYVGYKVDMQVTRTAVENTRYLQTGFAAVLDEKDHFRFLSAHANRQQAQQLLATPDPDWAIVKEDIPSWGFKVVIAYPLSEARATSLSNSTFVIGGGGALGILIVMLILWQLRRLIFDPIGSDPATAIDVVQRIAAGNLATDTLTAKQGTLMANVLSMREKLGEMVAALRNNAERMSLSASVFEHAHDGIFITDGHAHILEVNPAFTEITGYSRDEALGKTPQELHFASHDKSFFDRLRENQGNDIQWRGEVWNKRKSNDVYAAWLDLFTVRDEHGAISHYVGLFSDITQIKEHQQNLEHMAYHDALTQLPNRTLLADRLQHALARASRSGEWLAVCYFDLDGFKPINDTLGHEAGDRLLVQLAARIRACLREADTIARLGGDEFALLLSDLHTVQECEQTLNRLLDAIHTPFLISEKPVHISASIGYTLFPLDDNEPDMLLRHADHAMYQAKTSGGGRYHLFDAKQDKFTRDQRQARERLESALFRREFCLFYQPKVNMRHGQIVGLEALIRWQDPERGLRAPGDFLPAVENTDFVVPLGEWVISESLRQASEWKKAGLDLHVSVNIAARHIMQPDFALRLSGMLQEFPEVPPSQLGLEITETAAIEDVTEVARTISSCKLQGVTFALDDFGVGYSSLTYLRRLPVDLIKIDQSFVRDMLHDSDDLAVVAGVISLSRDFGRQVIAEGVETAEHGLQLLRMGCTLAQGYGIARPMPADSVPDWVRSYKPDESWDEGSL
jgi:diguanylate cyclase (GGDEF)-like protein/PAS domain S-box-containing protein